ncbi:hypothetical protein QEJ31_00455 [Pigmentibacter sp. JX0631]|uniref:hypothetical protein n=1 Tax=Pigmentibacter sp. JX0631 TaxID=2976982 RepID=UPI00246995CB|nr:hypothetical protein [Pigmentibacter sp. JX0631]WGL60073.1 hypothetical protein QEJ31_00455 [Pigmentibacter sp. JX0631]
MLKIKFYSRIFLSLLPFCYSSFCYADYTVNVSTLDYTKLNRSNIYFSANTYPPYSCPSTTNFPPGCQLVFNSGQASDVFYFFDPSGKKRFKFYLADSGNWSLNAFYGDRFTDLNSFLKIPLIGQIQLHGMFPVVYLYSNANGVYLKDQDNKVFELITWN